MTFKYPHRYLFLFIFLSGVAIAQKNKDPFARSARLPDMSVGLGLRYNTKVKYKVPGVSLNFNTTYYNFDFRFLIGLDFMTNLKRTKTTILEERDPATIRAESSFTKLIYNHSAIGLTGGWMLTERFYLVGGLNLELLEQFDQLASNSGNDLPAVFYRATGKKPVLFSLKYGVQYMYKSFVYDLFYSKRGISVGVNFFFNG